VYQSYDIALSGTHKIIFSKLVKKRQLIVRNIVMSSLCLYVRSQQSHTGQLCQFLRTSPAVARYSSDGDAIRYVLPVLWMTSRIHTMGSLSVCPNGDRTQQA